MDVVLTKSVTRWAVLGVAVVVSAAVAFTAWRHGQAAYRMGSPNPDDWLRAADEEPSNPENWHILGTYYALDFEHADPPRAISYLKRAVSLDPTSPYDWTNLAEAYESSGDVADAENAFRAAQSAYPISADVAWRFGNFLMRQNRLDEAFREIHQAVAVKPDLAPLAISRCWRSTQDVDRILTSALPPKPDVYWAALDFFVKAKEPQAIMATWHRIIGSGAQFQLPDAFPAVDILIAKGDIDNAKTVWQEALKATQTPPQYAPPESLIWNGGFEHDLLNGGLAWHYEPVQGASLGFDEEAPHSGVRSLRIVFDGTANVDFEALWQNVPVEPNTRYQFQAYVRADEVTTDSGIRFAVNDISPSQPLMPPQFTASTIGTEPWSLDQLDFVTGQATRMLRLIVQRPPSTRLGNKIQGSVWIDDVSLVPLQRTTP
jgi:hypothetical protein